jgi:uncharacterized membrane protein
VTAGPPAALAHAMPHPAGAALAGVLILATAVWAGGLVAIFVVARVASAALPPDQRVAFFRRLGRAYLPVGAAALLVALASGAVLLYRLPPGGLATAATWTGASLVAVTAAGVAQARNMTRLRRAALIAGGGPDAARRVRRTAHCAAALRMAIAALSFALIALGSRLAT